MKLTGITNIQRQLLPYRVAIFAAIFLYSFGILLIDNAVVEIVIATIQTMLMLVLGYLLMRKQAQLSGKSIKEYQHILIAALGVSVLVLICLLAYVLFFRTSYS